MSNAPSERLEFTVDAPETGQRLDAIIAAKAGRLSRSRFKALIKQGCVRVSGQVVDAPNARVNAGDVLSIAMPQAEDPEPKGEEIPLSILFEDEHLIVIDKPAGLVVHPGPGNWNGTLVNALIHHCGDSLSGIGGVRRPGIVHRLDKDTSGVMVVAKTDDAHLGLTRQFADHGRTNSLERAYKALVWGALEPAKGTVDAPIARSDNNRLKMAVVKRRDETDERGKDAITHFQVLKRYFTQDGAPTACLVECRLETGRTHQIRVHMAHLGHPLVGDDVYGSGFKTKSAILGDAAEKAVHKFRRQALFAAMLQFEHPVSSEILRFETDLPTDFAALIKAFNQFESPPVRPRT